MRVPFKTSLIVNAVTGVGVAGIFFSHFLTGLVLQGGEAVVSACSGGSLFDCEKTLGSSYGKILGVPVSVFATLYFGWMIYHLLSTSQSTKEDHRRIFTLPYRTSLLAVGVCLVFAGISFFVLHALCLYCLILDGLVALTCLLSYYGIRGSSINHENAPAYVQKLRRGTQEAQKPENARFLFGNLRNAALVMAILFLAEITQPSHVFLGMNSDSSRKVTVNAGKSGRNQLRIIKFTDFECPACQQSAVQLEKLREKYPKHVQVEVVHFPLSSKHNPGVVRDLHPLAGLAAKVGIVMKQKGKFDQYYKMMMIPHEKLTGEKIDRVIRQLNENVAAIKKLAESPEVSQILMQDLERAKKFDVHSTPTLVVNDEKMAVGVDAARLESMILGNESTAVVMGDEGRFMNTASILPSIKSAAVTAGLKTGSPGRVMIKGGVIPADYDNSNAYWVSPSGTSTWTNCKSPTDPGLASKYCSLATANLNAKAGDVVYLKGGTYLLTTPGQSGISPLNSGTSALNMLTFANAPGETPVIKGSGCYDCGWGVVLNHSNAYVRIDGITGQNLGRWLRLTHYANHNEITNCRFYSDTGQDVVSPVYISGACNGGAKLNCYSTHNWIHHNTFSRAHRSQLDPASCYEGRDLIRIGDPPNPGFPENVVDGNEYNTIENNYAEYAGHAILDSYGAYGVIRNNIMHNEAWITDTSGGTCSFPPMPNGLYGHRVMQTSEDFQREGLYTLIEDNRLGPSSPNPNNPGEGVYAIASPRTIVRYNDIFAGQQAGIYYKYPSYGQRGSGGMGATDNRVYNNTIYHNGQSYPYMQSSQPGCSTCPGKLAGITHYSDTRLNVDKNNIVYDNYSYSKWGLDITVDTGKDPVIYPLIGTLLNNWTTVHGNPQFVNPDLSDPTSRTLPNLSLQASSPAKDGGMYLTQAVGAGNNSIHLVVDDAMYFQDGTWGSDLARGVTMFPDWIAIGTVDHVAQIASIDYNAKTITLAGPATWSNGAKIWLYKKSDGSRVLHGNAPDYGAHEYMPPPPALFYVDPDYTGISDGSASKPWTALGYNSTTPQWTAVNAALANGPVTIYFSAREASSDVPDEIIGQVNVGRRDTSSNRLTLDGMSKFNTNDDNPFWVDYSGSHKMRIKIISNSFSIGWEQASKNVPNKIHYVTLRGFEITGNTGRITWGGSHTVIEKMWIHDITGNGATIQFAGAVSSYPDCVDLGKDTDVIVRDNLIERGFGEGIYIANNYSAAGYGGCMSYQGGHSDILIENNIIRDPGFNGGEGDAIDLKSGLVNVIVRNNVLERGPANTSGIVSSGMFPGAVGNYLIEGNRISRGYRGIMMGAQNGTVIRNNLIYNNNRDGISITGGTGDAIFNTNVKIFNNTIYGNNSAGISIGDTDGVIIRNNLLFGNDPGKLNGGYQIPSAWGSSNIDSDYNLFSSPGAFYSFPEGTHSITLSAGTAETAVMQDPPSEDFHLKAGSLAVDAGMVISSVNADFEETTRPQGAGWDIGAFEYVTANPDSDGDGLLDAWEIQHFGSIADSRALPDLDVDGDGMSNLSEQAAGTSPVDSKSRLIIISQSLSEILGFTVTWQSVSNKTYMVESSGTLTNWLPVASVDSTSNSTSWTDSTPTGARKFYRIKLP